MDKQQDWKTSELSVNSTVHLVINLQDMTALSAGFFGCVCFQFLSGSWSETSLQKMVWKQKQQPDLEKTKNLDKHLFFTWRPSGNLWASVNFNLH